MWILSLWHSTNWHHSVDHVWQTLWFWVHYYKSDTTQHQYMPFSEKGRVQQICSIPDVYVKQGLLKMTVHSAAIQVLGPVSRNHQDWFDENYSEIKALLGEKCQLRWPHHNDHIPNSKKDTYHARSASVEKSRESHVPCNIPGLATRLMRLKAMLTDMTWSTSTTL